MKLGFALIACAACGRVGFATEPELVDTYAADSVATGSVSVPVTLDRGDLAIAAIALSNPSAIMQVSDDLGDTYVSSGARAVGPSSMVTCEIWYANGVAGGTGTVTVTSVDPAAGMSLWVAEFSDVAPGPPTKVAELSMTVGAVASSPAIATTSADELVFALLGVGTGGAVPKRIDATSPFAALGDLGHGGAAYYVAATDGSYTAAWDLGFMPATCSSAVAFAAKP